MIDHIVYPSAALIALTNPVIELPIFLSLTEGQSRNARWRASLRVATAVLVILIASVLLGEKVLTLVGVTFPAFRAAGGLVLIIVALEMLHGGVSPGRPWWRETVSREERLMVPLVMPLLAGPTAIVAAISLSLRELQLDGGLPFATLIATVIAAVVVLLVLLASGPLSRVLGRSSARIFESFSGLILLAIGIQMGLSGARQFLIEGL